MLQQTRPTPQITPFKNHEQWIVVDDPTGKMFEGEVVGQRDIGALAARGATILPFRPDLGKRSGIGGYHKRALGYGTALHPFQQKIAGQIVLFCTPEYRTVFWAAKLIADESVRKLLADKQRVECTVRLAPDATQESAFRAGFSAQGKQWKAVTDLVAGNLDKHGAIVVFGEAGVSVQTPGFYPFALSGSGQGFRVAWVAATQA